MGSGTDNKQVSVGTANDRAARNWMLAWVVSFFPWIGAALVFAPTEKLTTGNVIGFSIAQLLVLGAATYLAFRRGRGEERGGAVGCVCLHAGMGTMVLAIMGATAVVDVLWIQLAWALQLLVAIRTLVALLKPRAA